MKIEKRGEEEMMRIFGDEQFVSVKGHILIKKVGTPPLFVLGIKKKNNSKKKKVKRVLDRRPTATEVF